MAGTRGKKRRYYYDCTCGARVWKELAQTCENCGKVVENWRYMLVTKEELETPPVVVALPVQDIDPEVVMEQVTEWFATREEITPDMQTFLSRALQDEDARLRLYRFAIDSLRARRLKRVMNFVDKVEAALFTEERLAEAPTDTLIRLLQTAHTISRDTAEELGVGRSSEREQSPVANVLVNAQQINIGLEEELNKISPDRRGKLRDLVQGLLKATRG